MCVQLRIEILGQVHDDRPVVGRNRPVAFSDTARLRFDPHAAIVGLRAQLRKNSLDANAAIVCFCVDIAIDVVETDSAIVGLD
jgi:hypothetical protein